MAINIYERFTDLYILRIRIMATKHYERFTNPFILRIRIMAIKHYLNSFVAWLVSIWYSDFRLFRF